MTMDAALMWAFLLVFVRCSAMLLSSPIFGAQSTPVQVRVFTTLAISACLTFAVGPKVGPLPSDAVTMAAGVAQEVAVGLLLGAFCNLVLQAVQMAGSFLDLQMGLSMSQALNPMTGVVEGFREALLGTPPALSPLLMGLSVVISLIMFVSGMFYFRRMEKQFADMI